MQEAMQNRIYFPGNPWPNGHSIENLSWEACYIPDSGFWFNLVLNSEDYDAEDESDFDEQDDDLPLWQSKAAWTNFQSCCIDAWGYERSGFLAFDKSQKFDLAALVNKTYRVDPLPRDLFEDNAFHIYLIGHDSIADHQIRFAFQREKGEFFLDWSGKIALTYSGNEEYNYTFQAYVAIKLGKIYLPAGNKSEAEKILNERFQEPELFELVPAQFNLCGVSCNYAAVLKA